VANRVEHPLLVHGRGQDIGSRAASEKNALGARRTAAHKPRTCFIEEPPVAATTPLQRRAGPVARFEGAPPQLGALLANLQRARW
jgi:hypothetical protein